MVLRMSGLGKYLQQLRGTCQKFGSACSSNSNHVTSRWCLLAARRTVATTLQETASRHQLDQWTLMSALIPHTRSRCLPALLQGSARLQTGQYHHRPSNARFRAGLPVGHLPSCITKRRLLTDLDLENAVANFFTPSSQKAKDRTTWTERSPDDDTPATLLVGRYEPETKEDKTISRKKIAAFDLDSTLISTSSGKKHSGSATDWKWWDNQVPGRLRQLYHEEGYRVVVLSNQAGLTLHFDKNFKGPKASTQKRVADFKQKCSAVLSNLNLPTSIYAATEKDIYRKPRTGMWKEVCEDYDIPIGDVDLENSIFIGDAGGRTARLGKGTDGVSAMPKDFSCSDRNFAHNVGISYQTPEEFFLNEKPRDFSREFDLADHPYVDQPDSPDVVFERRNDKDIVLFCGPPGAGKSTFYWKYLKPLGYERINQDTLKSRDKCFQAAREQLQQGNSIAIGMPPHIPSPTPYQRLTGMIRQH